MILYCTVQSYYVVVLAGPQKRIDRCLHAADYSSRVPLVLLLYVLVMAECAVQELDDSPAWRRIPPVR
jgi:hypothetical protein